MQRVHYERRDDVALVRIDDGKVNAIQDEFLTQLGDALDRTLADESARALVLVGRPGYFSAGLDLKVLPELPRAELRRVGVAYGRLMLRLHGFPRPVVGVATGHALAGGCVLLLACDRRIGAGGPFKIGLSEATIGVPLPAFVVEMARGALLPSALPEALLAGRAYDPESARAVGYLHEVCDPAAALGRGLALAREIGWLPALSYRQTKQRLKAPALEQAAKTTEADVDEFLTVGPFAG
jgi:enoyl-CoA hydratase